MEKFHLHYFSDEASNFDLKLVHQDNILSIVLSNGIENFIVEYDQDGNSKQRSLYQLDNLTIHSIQKP